MYHKSISYRRHQRQRVINKRKNILKNIWCSFNNFYLKEPGRLEKYNLSCNCGLCSIKTKIQGHKASEKRKLHLLR